MRLEIRGEEWGGMTGNILKMKEQLGTLKVYMDFKVSSKTCKEEQVLLSDLVEGNIWSQVMKFLKMR